MLASALSSGGSGSQAAWGRGLNGEPASQEARNRAREDQGEPAAPGRLIQERS